jgi:hypothetical protein
LLKAGADVNLKNRGGYTALAIAQMNRNREIARSLKASGAVD